MVCKQAKLYHKAQKRKMVYRIFLTDVPLFPNMVKWGRFFPLGVQNPPRQDGGGGFIINMTNGGLYAVTPRKKG